MTESTAPYQDGTLPVHERVADLVARMTLEEKAGLLFHDMIVPGPEGELAGPNPVMNIPSTQELLGEKKMSHFNLLGPVLDAEQVAKWHNALQQYALDHTRLGIPISLSTDPRNHFSSNIGTGFKAGVMSQWPEAIGLASLRSPELIRTFADCIRQEYLAVGLRVALHPQIDLATEYRWARNKDTFGEDGKLTAELAEAYIQGLQGPLSETSNGSQSVSTMTKHFPGAGPEKDGEDSHFTYGREQVYPGDNFDQHLEPFRKAIAAGTRQIMPSYAMPIGTKYEEVAFAFNKDVITGILRNDLGFNGIVCTDWGLITDTSILGQDMPARAWGCEHLTELERVVKIIEAGCDQFGGESRPELVVQAVKSGLVSESRINESVARVLTEKFVLGLFDEQRFVDVAQASSIVGNPKFVQLAEATQRRAFTLLVNQGDVLPLSNEALSTKRFYVEGLEAGKALERGMTLVETPSDADVALVRLQAPYEPRPGGFECRFHAGSLEFPQKEVERLKKIIDSVPITVLEVYLDRPVVLTPIVEAQEQAGGLIEGRSEAELRRSALVVSCGCSDDAFLDACFRIGDAEPQGSLVFDLPRSMEAVTRSREDVPFDTENPLFKFGFGLRYAISK